MKLTTRYSWLYLPMGYKRVSFCFTYTKMTPKTMSDVLYKATKYTNAEDALLAQEEEETKGCTTR